MTTGPSFDTPIPTSGLTRVCRLAEGGMGRVDLAIKRVGAFRRMYAVKRLHPHLATDPEFRQMFLDEARIAGLIRHPNVVGVLDVGEDELGPFLVMDYVDGMPLGNLVRRAAKNGEPMPVQIAVRIALDVARGLHAAHEVSSEGVPVGLVHRDLSPQNVMIGFDGTVRLTDFGIAKALGRGTQTATGVVKGKTSYLAPEQIAFDELDRRADLFSLGVVLFEMLSGARLYRRGDPAADMRAILDEPAPDIGETRADVPDALVQMLFELLAKSRDARPSTAREVAERLEAILGALIAHEGPASVADYVAVVAGDTRKEQADVLAEAIAEAERKPPPTGSGASVSVRRRRRAPWAVAVVVAIIVLGLTTFALEIARPAAVTPPAALPETTETIAGETPSVRPVPESHPIEAAAVEGAPIQPEAPATAELSAPEPVRRRPGTHRRPPRPASADEHAKALPGWVEFDP